MYYKEVVVYYVSGFKYLVVISCQQKWGCQGGAKVSCILRHRDVQLILAYSWARPAILVAGKGRGGMFLFLLFLHSFLFLFQGVVRWG